MTASSATGLHLLGDVYMYIPRVVQGHIRTVIKLLLSNMYTVVGSICEITVHSLSAELGKPSI